MTNDEKCGKLCTIEIEMFQDNTIRMDIKDIETPPSIADVLLALQVTKDMLLQGLYASAELGENNEV